MKKLVVIIILGLLLCSSFFFPSNKEAKAALCGKADDGVCCKSGSVCLCLPDETQE